jgi:DNA mismatch repair protein MutL
MNKIRVLPDQIANQIAAGEVVERPASVAKELVENSLDAGARVIRIDVEAGGRRLLRVTDDGSGMTRDDAVLAFERHATSKINVDSDISAIETLGFRGEALPSIASVARVELTTKSVAEDRATRIVIEGGRMSEVKDAAHPNGTTITMRDLFYNLPARRKFLRSEATESFHLTNLVTNYSLAQPTVSFTLQHNGREILRTPAAADLRERIYQIFGSGFVNNLLEVSADVKPVARIFGYISVPRERRNSRESQYLFVNGRSVRDRVLTKAVTEAYRPLLSQGAYPVAILFVELPWADVDVNVHPAKTEVRFRRSAAVAEAVRDAVQSALARAGYLKVLPAGQVESAEDDLESTIAPINEIAPKVASASTSIEAKRTVPVTASDEELAPRNVERTRVALDRNSAKPDSAQMLIVGQDPVRSVQPSESDLIESPARIAEVPAITEAPLVAESNRPMFPPLESLSGLVKQVPNASLPAGVRALGQLDQSFIVAADDQGLLLIDQHVAHERILFDRIQARGPDRPVESQALLVPETIDLTPAQAAVFDAAQAELESFGFELMRLSGRTIAVKSVPAELPASEMRNFLIDVIDAIGGSDQRRRRATMRDQIASRLACNAAIQSNTVLSFEKMTWLIESLAATSVPANSPHGRPVILRLAMRDLERAFRR